VATERVLDVAIPMLRSAEAVAVLGASLRLRRDRSSVDAELAARLDAVLESLGVLDVVDELDERETAGLLGRVESFLLQAVDLVVNPGRTGWDHGDPSILMAQGHWSGMLAPILQRIVVPSLGGALAARLETAGASLLDVGTGVGGLAIAVCRIWPALRVVGIDPWEPALALARENVAAAGLAARIDLRQTAAEALQDRDEHDLAWVPTFFISGRVLERVIERVHSALRPGGYAIFGLYIRPDDPLAIALADLRTVRHGGAQHAPHQTAALLTRAGFADIDAVEVRPSMLFVTGRRRGAHPSADIAGV
jgi:SAM-dependent methyltransferase